MLKQIIEKVVNEELSPLQKEYQGYFKDLLSKEGVSSPAEMDKSQMTSFFKKVSDGWVKGQGAK
jgi:hypothetical protein